MAVARYNPNTFTYAKLKQALTPDRLEMIDSLQAWVGVPSLLALGTWLSKVARDQALSIDICIDSCNKIEKNLAMASPELTTQLNDLLLHATSMQAKQTVSQQTLNDIHNTLVALQFVYLGTATVRLLATYRKDKASFNKYLLDEGVYTQEDFDKFNKDPRHVVRHILRALEVAGAAVCGYYMATPGNMLPAGIGLMATTGVLGNLSDFIFKQAHLMFAKQTAGELADQCETNYRELAKGMGWKLFGVTVIPAVILLLTTKFNGSEQTHEGEQAILPTLMNAAAFGLLSASLSFPGAISRYMASKYQTLQIEQINKFKDTRADVVLRPSFDGGKIETNIGMMDSVRNNLAILGVAMAASIVGALDADNPAIMLAISLLAGELYLLLKWQQAQDNDRRERMVFGVKDNPLPGASDGALSSAAGFFTKCFNKCAGYDQLPEIDEASRNPARSPV